MSAVPTKFLTKAHFNMFYPFLLGGGYILIKFFEIAVPWSMSEQDKRESRYLKQLKFRGIHSPLYPEYTAHPDGEDHHGHH